MANQRPWIFTQNPFLNATENSFRLAIRISNTHLAALKKQVGDPFFDALIASYEPLDTALNNAYNAWKTSNSAQQGETFSLNQLYRLLSSSKIRQWDIAVQNIYGQNTPQYKALLPKRREPFQHGSQTDRKTAVKTFSESLNGDAALAAVKTDVDNFYQQLSEVLSNQKGEKRSTSVSSQLVEKTRVAMCTGQYANLGALMQKYAETPEIIESFFDLAAIRSGAQVLFTGDTKPQEHENIFKHTFFANDTVRLENEGVTDLKFYLADSKNAPLNGTVVSVPAGETVTVPVTQLGNATNTFLNVHNPDNINKGEWKVEIE